MAKKSKNQQLVDDFIRLNGLRSKRTLRDAEVRKWYRLKNEIEEKLFFNPPMASDKRRSIRLVDLNIPVELENALDSSPAEVREMSEGGLFVALVNPPPVGSEINLRLLLEDQGGYPEEELEIAARVIYTNSGSSLGDRAFSGMGMVLSESLHPQEKQKWFLLMDHLLHQVAETETV